MYISPVLSCYCSKYSINAIEDYKIIKDKCFQQKARENVGCSTYIIKTNRKIKDLSDYLQESAIQKECEKSLKSAIEISSKISDDLFDFTALNTIVENLKNKDFLSELGLGAFSTLYKSEDLRQVTSAYDQIKSLFGNDNSIKSFNYSNLINSYKNKILGKYFSQIYPNKIINKVNNWIKDENQSIEIPSNTNLLKKITSKIDKLESQINDLNSIKNETKFSDVNSSESYNPFKKQNFSSEINLSFFDLIPEVTDTGINAYKDIQNTEKSLPKISQEACFLASPFLNRSIGTTEYKYHVTNQLGSILITNNLNTK